MLGPRYLRDERILFRLALAIALIVGILTLILRYTMGERQEQISPEQVWSYIQKQAPPRGLDPEFVYALAWAESGLDARASSSVARGMMQLTRQAWAEVSDEPYRHAWDWKTNIRVSIEYLVFCRDYLNQNDRFSYPLLAASYRYGPYYVASKSFNLAQVKPAKNEIYRRLFNGNIRPVPPPY
ncbi:MAG: transglycosylase SLT domain-containing protein [Opitutales bacterium]